MKFFYLFISILAACCISCFVSCKKLIAVDPPADQLTTGTVFSNDESATAALRGIYSEIMKNNNYIGNGAMSIYPGLSADEFSRSTANVTDDAYSNNVVLPNSTPLLNNIWQKGYFHIYQCNVLLENLAGSNNISADLKKQLEGEAKFFRAFFHFYLTNVFGAIPLVTGSDYRDNAAVSRTDTSLVYAQIIKDLTEAENLLPVNYVTGEKVRVNKWAASALLARVYLYQRDWAHAEAEASAVIQSGTYQLSSLNNVFLPNSSEAILQFIPAITQIFNTSEAASFLPSSAAVKPTYNLTKYLLNAFDSGDQRKTSWIKTATVSGINYSYPYKYKVRTGVAGAAKSEYNMVLRLAEQYLIRAEARAEQNNITGAQDDVNRIRNRAGLPNTTANEKASLLPAIEKERQTELFCEWGHRWFDLKRTGRADAVLGVEKAPNWKSTAALFPIPQAEILANPSLTQNAGY